jgi:hypothetical protein
VRVATWGVQCGKFFKRAVEMKVSAWAIHHIDHSVETDGWPYEQGQTSKMIHKQPPYEKMTKLKFSQYLKDPNLAVLCINLCHRFTGTHLGVHGLKLELVAQAVQAFELEEEEQE